MTFKQTLNVPANYMFEAMAWSAPYKNIKEAFNAISSSFHSDAIMLGTHVIPYCPGSVNGTNPSEFVVYGSVYIPK